MRERGWGAPQADPKTGLKGPVKLWEGSPMTIYSKAVANWDTTGYGSLLESPSVGSSLLFDTPLNPAPLPSFAAFPCRLRLSGPTSVLMSGAEPCSFRKRRVPSRSEGF